MTMRTISLRLEDDLADRLVVMADACDESVSEFIRTAISDRLRDALLESNVRMALQAKLTGLDAEVAKRRAILEQILD